MLVYVTTADSERLALHQVRADVRTAGAVPLGRLADPTTPGAEPAELGVALDALCAGATAIAVRLLGGRRTAPALFDGLRARARTAGVPFFAFPGEREPDPELTALSTADPERWAQAFAHLLHGGLANMAGFVGCCEGAPMAAPVPLPWHGIYRPERGTVLTLPEWRAAHQDAARPTVAVLFYRAHWLSGNTDFVVALIGALERAGANALPVFCYSLRAPDGPDPLPTALRETLVDAGSGQPVVDAVITTLAFASGVLAEEQGHVASWNPRALEALGVPVIQGLVVTGARDDWAGSSAGLSPIDAAMAVALPELDGRIGGVPFSFKEEVDGLARYVPDLERTARLAQLAVGWARLRRRPPQERRVALILSNYPTRSGRVGNGVGLDTPASVVALLRALRDAGYDTGPGPLPADGDALIHALVDRGGYDREQLTSAQLRAAVGQVAADRYHAWWSGWPEVVRTQMARQWGPPPGTLYRHDGHLALAGLRFGRVLVALQPPRGFGEDPIAIYHDPLLPPPHHYLAFYRWLAGEFSADAVVHVGKHGTVEWLPGKSLGLSEACYPDLAMAGLPHLYPFIVNDPGEGTQAKRRSSAVIIDHLIPPMTTADSYGALLEVEQLMDEYYEAQALDPEKLPRISERLWDAVQRSRLDQDLQTADRPGELDPFLLRLDGYLCELKDAPIRAGLHVLGRPPTGQALEDLCVACLRTANGDVPSLRAAILIDHGRDPALLQAEAATPVAASAWPAGARHAGDVVEAVQAEAAALVHACAVAGFDPDRLPVAAGPVAAVLTFLCRRLVPAIRGCTAEVENLLRGLDGGFVPPGPSGAPTRGMAHVLPTGRNFYAADPRSLPSETAWEIGQALAEAVVARHREETGTVPRSVGIVVWGTAAMRTHGDDVAEVLALLGVRPRWDPENRRVRGLEVIPLAELGRPRVDVTVRISGFFRDAFPNLVELMDDAVALVAALDEPDAENFVAARVRAASAELTAAGVAPAEAARRARYRIFGSPPGAYGAGILPLLDAGNWRGDQDLAAVYTTWGSYAYGRGTHGVAAPEEFRDAFRRMAVAIKNQDNREHDIFDSDDYLQYHGGMVATVRALTGQAPRAYFGDSANPTRPRVRPLQEEARRVFRSRVVNPKWIDAMRQHGYKGAFEMAATVDYLYGYDATAHVADDWMYEGLAQAYCLDPSTQAFLRQANPWALRDILDRLLEAAARELWRAPDPQLLERLRRLRWELDAGLEQRLSDASARLAVPAPPPPVPAGPGPSADEEGAEEEGEEGADPAAGSRP